MQLQFNGTGPWHDATSYLKQKPGLGRKIFSWTLWKYEMPVSMINEEGKVSVRCRAIANDGEIQEGHVQEMFNVRGLMNNSCDELNFQVTGLKQ